MTFPIPPINAKLDLALALDPIVDLDHKNLYFVSSAGTSSVYTKYPTNNVSNSTISYNIPTMTSQIMSRYILQSITYQTTFTGPANVNGGNLLQGDALLALRAYPIATTTLNLIVNINTNSFQQTPYQWVAAMQRIGVCQQDTHKKLSTFPSLSDNCQQYSDYYGSTNSVLNGPSSSTFWQQGRGSYNYNIISNTPTSAIVQVTVCEPLVCSPLTTRTDDDERGFHSVSQFSVTQSFRSTLNDIWSMDFVNGPAFTNIVTNITGVPALYIKTIQPNPTFNIPRSLSYPYNEILIQQTLNASPVTAGANFQMTSLTTSLSYIPDAFVIFAQRQQSDYDQVLAPQYTKSFAEIQSVSVTFGTRSGLLSSASEYDLWRMSSRNGSNITWPEWSGAGRSGSGYSKITAGSVLIIKPHADLGLAVAEAPGVALTSSINMQFILNMVNPATSSIAYTLTVLAVTAGVATIVDNRLEKSVSICSPDQVLDARELPRVPHGMLEPMLGAGLNIGRVLTKINDALKKTKIISSVAKHIPQVGAQVSQFADELGYGGGLSDHNHQYSDQLAIGGKRASKKNLQRRLMN